MSTEPEVMRALGRIEANQNSLFHLVANQTTRLDSHSERLGALETSHAKIRGLVIGGIGVVSGVTTLIYNWPKVVLFFGG